MTYQPYTFVAFVTLLYASCGPAPNPGQDTAQPSVAVVQELDTIVHSFPLNYLQLLETLPDSSKITIGSYQDLLELFDRLDYTPETWQAGIRVIPRVYLTIIGDRWGTTTTKEITVLHKKRIFFRGIAPLILHANEGILKDRERLAGILKTPVEPEGLSGPDSIWIARLAQLYKVATSGEEHMAPILEELWMKVDMIPPSLALAQGAIESGWGTSRFAAQGNALYGQWSWGKDAMIPEEQRKELGNYGIAAFPSLQESVSAYMLNLNTHAAYADLRAKRAELRKSGSKLSGMVLADGLLKYSEMGASYVQHLKDMMEYNRLSPVDDAFLAEEGPLYLIPVPE
jgi:uncharacterized FlgJ-related protein